MKIFTSILLIAISLILILGVVVSWSFSLTVYSLLLCFVAMAGYSSFEWDEF